MLNNLSWLASVSHITIVYFWIVDTPTLYKSAIRQDFFTKDTFPFQDVIVDWNDGNMVKVRMNLIVLDVLKFDIICVMILILLITWSTLCCNGQGPYD
jgi:hypothetical protein